MTERDGSFRRLMQTVKAQQAESRTGDKSRIPVSVNIAQTVHDRVKSLANARSVTLSDLYNDAIQQLVTDLHHLLGDELRLPLGAFTMSGVLGLRELIDRPIRTPLRELDLRRSEDTLHHTTLYLAEPVWEGLMELSYRFVLQLRRSVSIHRLIELAAAWYLCEFDQAS